MADQIRVTSSRGWFSRIGESIKGLTFGAILFLGSFPLLWWNEGRAVQTYESLQEGRDAVVSVKAETVDPANESGLVHLTGLATTRETLADSVFGVAEEAIRLSRKAETYQWVERRSTESRKKLGGGEETVTLYTYAKDWRDERIDSDAFKEPAGHANPPSLAFESQSWQSQQVMVGTFQLSEALIASISRSVEVPYPSSALAALSPALRGTARIHGKGLYIGRDPASPAVGDVRVSYRKVPPGDVSVIAQQVGTRLGPYPTKAGDRLEALVAGVVSADGMFTGAERSNTVTTWVLRFAGFLVMLFAMLLLLRPIRVLGDVVPILGTLAGFGLGLVAFLVAAPLTLFTIALAWIAHRPGLAVGLILVACAFGAWLLVRLVRSRRVAAPVPV